MCEDAALHDNAPYSCNGFLRLLLPVCYDIVNIVDLLLKNKSLTLREK